MKVRQTHRERDKPAKTPELKGRDMFGDLVIKLERFLAKPEIFPIFFYL
jgi:hypothetical protein